MDDLVNRSSASQNTRAKPIFSPRFVQAMLAGHSALGLAFATLIYVVCLAGTIAVFKHEIERWEQPNAPVVNSQLSSEAIQEAVWSGYGQALIDSASQQLALLAPDPLSPRFLVSYFDAVTGNEGTWIADANGHFVARKRAPFFDFVEDLHTRLRLPKGWGGFIVGLTGVALLSSLISGLLSHPRIFKDAFYLRWGGSERLQNADLHNRLAVWGLPFHFVVSTTGALLGLSALIVGILAMAAYGGNTGQAYAAILGPRAPLSNKPGPIPDIAAMIKSVEVANPTAVLVGAQIDRPGKDGEIIRIRMRTPGHLAFGNAYYFDGAGRLLGDGGLETGSVGQQILGALQPVHYGWFGSLGTKLIYGALGLALVVVTQSGVAIWLARRRGKGRPSSIAELLWATVTWSQPFALAVVAIESLRMDDEHLPAIYACALAVSGVVALASGDRATCANRLRLMTGAALTILVLAHATMWWHEMSDPIVLPVSAALLVIGAVIAARPLSTAVRFFSDAKEG